MKDRTNDLVHLRGRGLILNLIEGAMKQARKDGGPEFDVTDVLEPEGCMRVEISDKVFHIVVTEIDADGNEV